MAQGRMIDKKISISEQVANLSLPAQLVFTWMIPHADDFGLLPYSARSVKALVVPMIEQITSQQVEAFLNEMQEQHLIEVIEWKNEKFFHLLGFELQKLRKDIKPHTIAKDVSEWNEIDTVLKRNVTDTERVVTDLSGSDEQVKLSKDKLSKYNNNIIADKQRLLEKNENKKQETTEISNPYQRVPVEKASQLQRIVYHLEDSLHTKIVNWGKQAKALKMLLLAGYTEEQIKKSITYLSRKSEFYEDKGFDLMTLTTEMPRLQAKEKARERRLSA